MFINTLKKKAATKKKTILFPEYDDPRILKAAHTLSKESLLTPVLVFPKEPKKKFPHPILVIDNHPSLSLYANELVKIRKKKGLTLQQAKEWLKDPIVFGIMALSQGEADGLLSGAKHPTADTLRPALQILKTEKGTKTASSFFFMIKEKEVLLFADCALNVDPNPEELAEIALTTARSAKNFGISPKVAFLSFSTYQSAKHPSVDKVREAVKIAQKKGKTILIDGELQFDAAYLPSIAKMKAPKSPVKGKANIFIFPTLDAGNIGYKIAQRLGNYQAIGPIVQGLTKPVNDLSRGCSVEDIIDVAVITALLAK